MNIQVNKDQLERVAIKWLNKYYSNLIPKKHNIYPNVIFYVNSSNQVMMEYDQKHNYVFIHFRDIWSKIESLFHLENDDVISIMKIWLDKEYELEGVTPDSGDITTTDEFGSKLEVI